MNIAQAQFVKGILGNDPMLDKPFLQVAFVGRSNAGKSSLINTLTRRKDLARTSNTPGRTREINLFLINNNCYFLDLPGYGFSRVSKSRQMELEDLVASYLFRAEYPQQKIVQVIDGSVGPTKLDLEVLKLLEEHEKNIIVVANKFDKVRKTLRPAALKMIQEKIGEHKLVAFSSRDSIGRAELLGAIM